MQTELRFRAMGADAHVVVVGGRSVGSELAGRARRRVLDLEARWSRFRPTSEISELNRRAGEPVRVSPDTVLLVRRAIDAFHLSGGAIDATVLGAVIRAGYDRSFELLGPGAVTASDLELACSDIQVGGDVVVIPRGTGFDPGGIGKGLAADVVIGELLADGAAGACVNLGGDLRVAGESPGGHGRGWAVAVDHPDRREPITRLGIAEGAVATSTTLLRAWHRDGERRHHVIDPATGRPSDSDLTLASVVAAEGWVAEVLAKAILLRGSARAFGILAGTGAEGLAVDRAGVISQSEGFAAYCAATTAGP